MGGRNTAPTRFQALSAFENANAYHLPPRSIQRRNSANTSSPPPPKMSSQSGDAMMLTPTF